jgi:Ca2+-binding EF-hand superfamily protein
LAPSTRSSLWRPDFEDQLRAAFDLMELDRLGTIDKREPYDALYSVGIDGSSHQQLDLFRTTDLYREGVLGWPAVCAIG